MRERWKNIDGFPGYKISSFGRVKSLARIKKMPTGGLHILSDKIMQLKKVKKYNYVKLSNGKHTTKRVNRMVAISFVPNPNNKPDVNHKDTDKGNDYYKNLEWCTKSENMKHAYKHGLLTMPWEKNKKII